MAWRLAESLTVLRNQANRLAPQRSKASDGTIGDQAHQNRKSDHNPNQHGVVTALDLTHDPEHGADMHVWANSIIKHRHPALDYVIWDEHIAGPWTNYNWQYHGRGSHVQHMHVSVQESPALYDLTNEWVLEKSQEKEITKVNPSAVLLSVV